MKRKKIYVCAPWRGKNKTDHEKNVTKTEQYWRWLYVNGYHPVAPQLLYGRLLDDDDPRERRDGMSAGQEWLLQCDELWVFGTQISPGMKEEIRLALRHKIPINYVKEPADANK